MSVNPQNPAQLLRYAMENAGDETMLYPCLPHTVGLARESKKHGRRASITVGIPDERVAELTKGPDTAPLLMFVLIPREVIKRAEVGLVTPGLLNAQGRRV